MQFAAFADAGYQGPRVAWINRNRYLVDHVEATIASAEAFLYAASAILPLPKADTLNSRFETDLQQAR